MEKNTKNKGTFKYGRGAAAAVILTAGAAMLSGCVAVEASKPASGAVVVSDAAQKEGTLTVVSSWDHNGGRGRGGLPAEKCGAVKRFCGISEGTGDFRVVDHDLFLLFKPSV